MSSQPQTGSGPSGPSEDYKKRYEVAFQGDVKFSQEFMPDIQAILNEINFPKEIQDNMGTELNSHGYDLTIKPIQIGVRIRRFKYLSYDQFTQDDKERATMTCDYYFFGYADQDETGLVSYMVFDYKDYERQRGERLWGTENIPCVDRRQNKKHSLVYFNCYRNNDILKHCKIYARSGNVAYKPLLF